MRLLILAPEFRFAQGEDSGRKRPARVRTSFPVSEVVSMMLGIWPVWTGRVVLEEVAKAESAMSARNSIACIAFQAGCLKQRNKHIPQAGPSWHQTSPRPFAGCLFVQDAPGGCSQRIQTRR